MTLRVTLAGRVGIEVDGGEVTTVGLGRPGRLALAYLTCERHRTVPREELAEVLWGDERPQSADQMLRGVAFKLRTLLSASGLDPTQALDTAAGAFRLTLPTDAVVDVEEAAAALAGADASLAAGYAGAARAQAAAALAVAARQFAPTLTGAWVERRQAELAELQLRALETVARAAVAEGDWAGAIAAADEAIAGQPFRESAYLVLMDAHAGAGNRGEALAAYSRCREVLVEELGVDPSPPTEAAYLRLLGDEPAPSEMSSQALPLPTALARVPGSFLVGRQVEVEALEAALKRAGVDGRQAVLVGGEPGAGKTTLVAELARAAHGAGARVLYGRCDEELAMAYQPFAQALGHYVATAPMAELKAHVAASGGILARLVPELTRRLPEAVAPPSTSVEADRWALFEAVTDVLGRAAKETIVVVVLDDLHWAAPATLALLRHLLVDPSPVALLILGTYRHTDTPPGSPLDRTLADLRRAPAVERIALEGLDAEGVAAFVAVSGADDDDGALAAALHAHTAGNPFFVGELLRHLTETGATYRRQGPWSYYADAEGLEVPDAAVEVVGRRLGRLSAEANRALILAAVAGAEFDLAVLEAAESEPAGAVLDGLEEAQRASLVLELDRPGHYRFAHALVRHAIYGTLSGVRRARLHRRIGDGLESLPGDDATRLSALAHHFAEAASAGGAPKAADYAIAAADRALVQGAPEDAISALERGLEALAVQNPPDLRRRAALLLALALAFFNASENEKGIRNASFAADAARAAGDVEQFAEAAFLQALGGRRGPGPTEVVETALQWLGPRRLELRARLLAGLAAVRDAFGDTSVRLSDEAVALARDLGDPAALGDVLLLRGRDFMGTPRASALLATAEELVAIERRSGDVHGHHPGRGFHPACHDLRAAARLINGDRDGFDEDVQELERIGRETRAWGARFDAARWRVAQAFMDGRFTAVEAHCVIADKLYAEKRPGPRPGGQRTMLSWEQGRFADMVASAAHDLEARPQNYLFRSQLTLARALIGASSAAQAELAALTAELAQQRRPGRLWIAHLAEIAAVLQDASCSARIYEALRPYAGQVLTGPIACCLGSADRHLGMLVSVTGRWEEAEAHFEAALATDAGLRSPPLLARTQYWYAHLLATMPGGDRAMAADLAETAQATAAGLGMAGVKAQAEALLGTL
jgi:DNA-binding SARP family transcriptional activator